MEGNLDDLKELFTTIETQEKTPELVNWMGEISAKEYGLVDSLITTFMESLSDIKFANSVLRVLKILNQYIPDLVMPQMRENTSFPKAIVQYISSNPIKELEGDGFLLLVEIFQASSFKDVATDAFINALFESFEHLRVQEIYLAIISIIISISYEQKDLSKNPVLKCSTEHANRRLFAEGFILLLNQGHPSLIVKLLKFTCDILTYPKTKDDFFYTNDANEVMNILLREIANTSSDELRRMYLNVLEAMLDTEFYKKERPRSKDIKPVLDDCDYIDDISPETQNKIKEILQGGRI